MIINLFSVFDPAVKGLQVNWVSLLVVLIVVPRGYYCLGGEVIGGMFKKVRASFRDVRGGRGVGLVVVVVRVFGVIVLNNYLGLFPFVFTATAHPLVTIGVGVVYWVSFVLIGWVIGFKRSLAHIVPEGRPVVLAPVLVLIEVISHLMRPFTLSIRLAANIIAGHLIVGLLSGIRMGGVGGFIVSVLSQRVLLVLEWGVAIIQGVVFGILVLLYALEYY